MDAKELRIGNVVYLVSKNRTYEIDFGHEIDNGTDSNDIKPILLTESWLIKFGFKPFSKDFSLNGIIIHTRKRGFVLRKSVPIIKYVHQLQNLYFALTGDELSNKTKEL